MPPVRSKILVLGGTADANALAARLAADGFDAMLSYAGRTENPKVPPIPFRVGGFGGVAGLVSFLKAGGFSHLIDATHPFAAQMSGHAFAAAAEAGVALLALERPPWERQPGDNWIEVETLAQAAEALGETPSRVFLAIGRLHLDAFAGQQQHSYLVRLIDPPQGGLPLPDIEVVVARGPFDLAGDLAMLRRFRADVIVAKNAGGPAAYAKIAAARELGIPVILQRRPLVPQRPIVDSVDAVMDWLAHGAASLRGV